MRPPLSGSARTPTSLTRSTLAHLALSAFLVAITILPSFTRADITCTTFKDTFRVGDSLKFVWSDTQTYNISDFNLDLYCVETGKLVRTLATLNTNTSSSPVEWAVDSTIEAKAAECPRHQYSASFDWHYADPITLAAQIGTGSCNRVMLFIPSGTGPTVPTPDQGDSTNTDDQPTTGQIFISDKTKTIIFSVGGAVGALVLAGFVGFYFIRYKNRRAEETAASRKLREPLHASAAEEGGSGSLLNNRHGDGTRYSVLTSVTTTLPGEKMELDPMESSYSTASAASASGTHLPMMKEHTSSPRTSMRQSMQSDLSRPRGSFANERPASLLTSSFTPPAEDEQRQALRTRQREEQERQQYDEQLQQQQQQQLQMQHQQQQHHQQQQQQQNFGSYPF